MRVYFWHTNGLLIYVRVVSVTNNMLEKAVQAESASGAKREKTLRYMNFYMPPKRIHMDQ